LILQFEGKTSLTNLKAFAVVSIQTKTTTTTTTASSSTTTTTADARLDQLLSD